MGIPELEPGTQEVGTPNEGCDAGPPIGGRGTPENWADACGRAPPTAAGAEIT